MPDEITEEIWKKVQDLIETATKTLERTTAWEAIQQVLVEHMLALIAAQLPCDQVGVHPENRSRYGVGGTEAQKHGKDVLTEGFSWKKASDAACLDCPPPPLDAEHKAFNRSMCDQSQGIIPPLSVMTALSVGGSHTNTFCRQVKACVLAVVDGLQTTADGKLDAATIKSNRPSFADAVDQGMHWFNMHWDCPYVWPGLTSLIQSALNTVSSSQQGEVEMMLFIHKEWLADIGRGNPADFDAYEVRAKASMPPCSSYMKDISSFVKKYAGGGEGGELLTELNNFTKTFAFCADGPLRRLGGELLHKVVSLQWPKNKVYPRVINALLMTNLSSTKAPDGICRLLTPASLSELTSKGIERKVQNAEEVMEHARDVCVKLGVAAHHKTKLLGQLDVRCITHIKKIEKEHEHIKFQSLERITEAFVK
ncbi:hypothetical protein N9L68_01565 [bacterium]|nr:hypothetical protein [bacterium]